MSKNDKTVLSEEFGGGPHGYGDPNDRTLRKVETEIKIPQLMRDMAKKEKCVQESAEFQKCCADNGLLMTFKCKPETKILYSCLEKWYKDDQFKSECTELYLEQRRQFRILGNKKDMKKKEVNMF